MLITAGWLLLALGVVHTVLGFVWFKRPFAALLAEGVVGRVQGDPQRRLAFWFTVFGPLLMLAGHVVVHAAQHGDLALLRLVGWYLLPLAMAGVAALPRTPFWVALLVAPLLIASGSGWIG